MTRRRKRRESAAVTLWRTPRLSALRDVAEDIDRWIVDSIDDRPWLVLVVFLLAALLVGGRDQAEDRQRSQTEISR